LDLMGEEPEFAVADGIVVDMSSSIGQLIFA